MIKQFEFKPDIEYIKIHGLQRTGTNYVAKILGDNLLETEVLINAGGWKHGHYCAPWTLGREVHVIAVTKNPYAWLVSLYRYWKNGPTGPDLSSVSFNDFVRRPAIFEEAAGTPFLLRASNPVQHWNNMNFHWLSIRMNQKLSLVVPYEAFLFNTCETIKSVGSEFNLKTNETLINCDNVCEPGEETPKIGSEVWQDREYYVSQQYMNEFNQSLLDFVNKELDYNVLHTLGYQERR